MWLPSTSSVFVSEMSQSLSVLGGYSAAEKSFFQDVCGTAAGHPAADAIVADAWNSLQMGRFPDFMAGKERSALQGFRLLDGLEGLRKPVGRKTAAGDGEFLAGLERTLRAEPHPELALSVYEVDIDGYALGETSNRLFYILSVFCERIETALGGRIPLIDSRSESWEGELGLQPYVARLSVRILSPRLFQRALESAHPDRRLVFDYRNAEYQGEVLRDLRRRNVLGTSLPWEPAYLKDVQSKVPAWFYRVHDDYHKADQVLLPEENRAALDRFSDLLLSIRASFSGTEEERELLDLLQDLIDDREALFRFSPRAALERIWSFVALYYVVLPVLEPYRASRKYPADRRLTQVLLKRHYLDGIPLQKIAEDYLPRCAPSDREAYRRAVDYMLRRAARYPDPETSAFMKGFFEDVRMAAG